MRLNDDEIAAILENEIAQAVGSGTDALDSMRTKALNYYQGTRPGAPTAEGRSKTVSMDVAEAIHAISAQLGPILKSSIVEFPPESQEDVAGAQMESDIVRRTLQRSDGYTVIGSATHDALLLKNGWLWCRLETQERTDRRVLAPDIPAEAFAGLPDDVSIERDQNGAVVLTRTSQVQRLVIESVPTEQVFYSSETSVSDVQQLRLVGRRCTYTVAALMAMGVRRELAEACLDAAGDEISERARAGLLADTTRQALQDSLRVKRVQLCWAYLDTADNGKPELWEVWLGGGAVLKKERRNYRPCVTGSAIPMPHRIDGMAVAELLFSIQDAKTETLRNFLDNLSALLSGKVGALEGEVRTDDLTNGRINGIVRMTRADAIFPLPTADIGPQAIAGMGYLDQVRSKRVGAALDQTEVQAQLMSASATAAAGQQAAVEMMTGFFAGNLANTLLRGLFLLVHRMLRDSDMQLMGQRAGQWVPAQPSSWPERDIAEVTLGLTTAQRSQRMMALVQVLTQQTQLMQNGFAGILTDPARLYNAMCDWLRAADLADPDQYFLDPASPQSMQAAQQQAQQAQAAQQQQAQQLQQMVQMQQGFELEKQGRELEYKRWSDLLEARIKELDRAVDEARVMSESMLGAMQQRTSARQVEASEAAAADAKRSEKRAQMDEALANDKGEDE